MSPISLSLITAEELKKQLLNFSYLQENDLFYLKDKLINFQIVIWQYCIV